MRHRLAFARFFQETNALSPVLTDDAAFARFETGPEGLLEVCRPGNWEVAGIWKNAELSGFCRALQREGDIDLVPLFSAMAIPSGKLSHATFDRYLSRLLSALREAAPLSGLYLALHGAMGVEGIDDPEGEILQAVRVVVGDIPVVVSFDLHGFLTKKRVDNADLFVFYHTHPHRDQHDVGMSCARHLLSIVRRQIRPVHAWRSLPMVLGGAPTVDFLMPMRPLFRRMAAMQREPGVMTAGLLCCQPWHDAPALGWCSYVAVDGDRDRAEVLADEIAEAAWGLRHHLPPEVPGPEEALDQARRAKIRRWFGTACLSDCSDAVGAGGVGEGTDVTRAALQHAPDLAVYSAIRDANAVEALQGRPVGARIEIEVGGRLAPQWYRPLGLSGTVHSHHETTQLGGRSVVVAVGQHRIALTTDAPVAIGPGFWKGVGLSPWSADVCVVKSWMAFRFYCLAFNRLSLWAKTRGVTDLDAMQHISYGTPVAPFAAIDDWRPSDRKRRT